MFMPSVQFVKINPALGVAVTVAVEPCANEPAPVTVPLNAGNTLNLINGMVVKLQL